MANFFHVDSSKALKLGQVIERHKRDVGHHDFQAFFDAAFPEGVTRWGEFVVTGADLLQVGLRPTTEDLAKQSTAFSEFVLELVRRPSYPDKPSRFEAFFAAATLADARRIRSERGWEDAPIVKVEASQSFRADMRLIGMGGSILSRWLYADWYWSNRSTAEIFPGSPIWESLLEPPVKVIQLVG